MANKVEFEGIVTGCPEYGETLQKCDIYKFEIEVIDDDGRIDKPLIIAYGYLARQAERMLKNGTRVRIDAKFRDYERTTRQGYTLRPYFFKAVNIYEITKKGRTEITQNICNEQLTL